jgi:hypothetical protein
MKPGCQSVVVSLFCWFLFGGLAQGQVSGAADATKNTLWYVPHTHWEGAVFKTREEYLDMGLPIILRALNTLKAATWIQVHFGPGRAREALSGSVSGRRGQL